MCMTAEEQCAYASELKKKKGQAWKAYVGRNMRRVGERELEESLSYFTKYLDEIIKNKLKK